MLEVASRLIIRKTAAQKPLQIYRGNAQQVAFNPIKWCISWRVKILQCHARFEEVEVNVSRTSPFPSLRSV